MKKWGLISLFFVFAGCATVGSVKTDYDAKADFQKFKTYAFIDGKEINSTGILSNSIIRQRVEGLLTEMLDSRGLKAVPLGQNPDLVVQYWIGVKDKQDIQHIPASSSYYGSYYYDHWGASYDRYVAYDYQEGTLIVDLINRESKQLAWRAYLVQVLADNKDTNLKTAHKNLKKAFENYPPQIKAEAK